MENTKQKSKKSKKCKALSENQNSLLEEFKTRDLCRNNIIISGVNEKNLTGLSKIANDSNERLYDSNSVKEIFNEIGAEDVSSKTISRLGKPQNDRYRLLKISCSDFD